MAANTFCILNYFYNWLLLHFSSKVMMSRIQNSPQKPFYVKVKTTLLRMCKHFWNTTVKIFTTYRYYLFLLEIV